MYRIMIADDETIVINALLFILEKEFPGEFVVETAKSGRSLIEKAESFRPEIALVDLMMPGIGGMDAMRELRKMGADTVFVVVSAFDEFDYAKEALSIGVLDYINKPIEKDQITAVLRRAMEQVDQRKKHRVDALKIREKLEIMTPVMENGLIYAFINGRAQRREIDTYADLLDIHQPNGHILALRFDEPETDNPEIAAELNLRLYESYETLRGMVKSRFPEAVVGPLMGNLLVAWIPVGEYSREEAYQARVQQIEAGRQLTRELRQTFSIQVRAAFGQSKSLYEGWESYQEALRAFSYGSSSVTHASDLSLGARYERDYPVGLEKQLLDSTSEGDISAALSAAGSFFEWMIREHREAQADIRLKCLEFVLRTETIGYTSAGGTYHFLSRSHYLEEVLGAADYEALRKWFLEKIQAAASRVAERKSGNMTDLADKGKRYIDEQYAKDISLDEISAKLGVSPYYFSRLFKKRTGQTFMEYLTQLRMHKAKELLAGPELLVKEISAAVGYSDQNYFSRAFKNYTGLSPSEYRTSILGKGDFREEDEGIEQNE